MQDLTKIIKSSLNGRLDIALINKITPYIVKGLEEAYKPDINSDERTRLVELLTVINEDATLTCPRYSTESTLEDCKGCRYDKEDGSCDYVEREADYLLANGAIVPPCKVGDKVYVVDYTRLGNMIFECEVEEISQFSYGTYYYLNWGVHIPRFKACQIDSFGKQYSHQEKKQKKHKKSSYGINRSYMV